MEKLNILQTLNANITKTELHEIIHSNKSITIYTSVQIDQHFKEATCTYITALSQTQLQILTVIHNVCYTSKLDIKDLNLLK